LIGVTPTLVRPIPTWSQAPPAPSAICTATPAHDGLTVRRADGEHVRHPERLPFDQDRGETGAGTGRRSPRARSRAARCRRAPRVPRRPPPPPPGPGIRSPRSRQAASSRSFRADRSPVDDGPGRPHAAGRRAASAVGYGDGPPGPAWARALACGLQRRTVAGAFAAGGQAALLSLHPGAEGRRLPAGRRRHEHEVHGSAPRSCCAARLGPAR
jgi:hypothetical protein